MTLLLSLFLIFSQEPSMAFWGGTTSCAMNAPSAARPVDQVLVKGTLDLRELPEAARNFPSVNTNIPGMGPQVCNPGFIRTAGQGQCYICLKVGRVRDEPPKRLPKKLTIGPFEASTMSLKCGDHNLDGIQEGDLISKEEMLKKLEAIKLAQPSPLHVQGNGQAFHSDLAQHRVQMFYAYDRCLRLEREINGSQSKFPTTVKGCMDWLKDHGRTTMMKFDFGQTDTFDSTDPDWHRKHYGFWTRDLIRMACKKTALHNYSFAIEEGEPKLALYCHVREGIEESTPIQQLALLGEGASVSKSPVTYSDCTEIEVKGSGEGVDPTSGR